ncbi:hypothetical protein [Vibrio sp. V39_P1S14PM300]|uniref:hypothetical protein n=1 Tax=Vibrio sp. V39_P1S14PM300 TaxID=1938690 RepID=UPI0013731C74|nr:hypothetical protein [Vibrio sp. V39_P1S14PM300]NAX20576.1 hypothetical protein [Vibrio sp. V39_P1S14PM300]
MKPQIALLGVFFILFGCDDAENKIDKAQEAANPAVDSLQDKASPLDFESLKLEQFEGAKEQAQQLTMAVQEALNVDLTNSEAITNVQDKIANSYRCFVDASSSVSAEKLMNKLVSAIQNQEVLNIVEEGVAKGSEASQCVM